MKKTSSSLLLAILLLTSLVTATAVNFSAAQNSGTNVSGIITSNTTWSQGNSPYVLTGNVLVNNGISLTIERGCTVNLNGYFIEVNGTLVAKGTSAASIAFKDGYQSNQGISFDPTSQGWNQTSGTGSIIEYASLDAVGIFCYNATPKITFNLFYNSGKCVQAQYAIMFIGPHNGTPMVISNNTFLSGYAQASIEMNSAGPSPPVIINNNFVGSKSTQCSSGILYARY